MNRITILPLLVCLLLASCGTDEAVRYTGEALTRTETILSEIRAREASAVAALESARALAEATGSKEAKRAVGAAERTVEEVRMALPLAEEAVSVARTSHDQAKAAREAGGSMWQTGLAALLGLIGGGAPLIRSIQKYRRARDEADDARRESESQRKQSGVMRDLARRMARLAEMEPKAAKAERTKILDEIEDRYSDDPSAALIIAQLRGQ